MIIPGMERAQLDSLYRKATLFVFPSLIENSPNILLEAMAYGLPVLAGDIEPMPEFGGEAARYFTGLSADDLSHRMKSLLSDEQKAQNFGQKAKERAQQYSWDVFTRNVVDLCDQSGVQG